MDGSTRATGVAFDQQRAKESLGSQASALAIEMGWPLATRELARHLLPRSDVIVLLCPHPRLDRGDWRGVGAAAINRENCWWSTSLRGPNNETPASAARPVADATVRIGRTLMRIVRIKEDPFVPLTGRSERSTLPDQHAAHCSANLMISRRELSRPALS